MRISVKFDILKEVWLFIFIKQGESSTSVFCASLVSLWTENNKTGNPLLAGNSNVYATTITLTFTFICSQCLLISQKKPYIFLYIFCYKYRSDTYFPDKLMLFLVYKTLNVPSLNCLLHLSNLKRAQNPKTPHLHQQETQEKWCNLTFETLE